MSAKLDAGKSGSFKIGGDIEIHRLGFGAMRITGPRVWGPPTDTAEAIRTLKRLPELGGCDGTVLGSLVRVATTP
jgi:pyridoxine 4-dehydrogenase